MSLSAEPRIFLEEESPELCHAFFRQLRQEAPPTADGRERRPYRYSAAKVNADYARRLLQRDRRGYAILRGDKVIGQAELTHIDPEGKSCECTICLVNDGVKNRGFGTRAERLLLRRAFGELGMETVRATVQAGCSRSEHVLQLLGFRYVSEDEQFRQFVIDKERFAAFSRREECV